MDEKKQTGFTLFPQPPTPPTRRSRASTKSNSNGSNKLTKIRSAAGRSHGRKPSTSTTSEPPQPVLVPAPLKIKKASEEIPPLPAIITAPTTPTRSKKEIVTDPRTPEYTLPVLPIIPEISQLFPPPQTPTRSQKPKPRTIAELVELEAGSKKRDSSRLSQWLDLEDGEVDRRRLSRYLGSVLDQQFELPTFEPMPRASIALLRRASRLNLDSVVERCECPSDAVICHCSSSPEFERFRNWAHHKPNSSVSSTACLVGVPRARFQPAFFAIPEPEFSSPPGLAFDEEDENEHASEALDWLGPVTPSRDDVFRMARSDPKAHSPNYSVSSPLSSGSWTPSKYQSFSRPFRPDSCHQSRPSDSSAPSTPSRSQSRSTAPKSGFLTSISTLSSFDFDFDMKARCLSLAQEQGFDFNFGQPSTGDRDSTLHFRADSNDSMVSQYELSTATATVTLSSSNFKPVLVTNTAKRSRTPSGNSPDDTIPVTPSSKSFSSSISVPEYWHHLDTGLQVVSRSTTTGSKATDKSAAMSAMLTMPLLAPKSAASATQPTPGNAFAQRSDTSATMPQLPSNNAGKLLDGVADIKTEQPLNRSKTSPNMLSPIITNLKTRVVKHTASPVPTNKTSPASTYQMSPIVSSKMSPASIHPKSPNSTSNKSPARTIQMSPIITSKMSPTTSSTNSHVQAHANASARLKAFMEGSSETSASSSSTAKIGLGLSAGSMTRRKKNYLCVDEGGSKRNDSGIFGRLSVLGAVPGRREFSEPQFYRGLDITT